jgi:glycosyltransferase involved in cell wall biosynthesis
LLPSLRDNAPVTLTEAMLAGCVPVVADSGGPGIMVNDACGYLIPVHHRRQMVAELTDVIITIDRDRSIIREKGQAASQRIAAEFSEENYRRQINVVYQSVLTKKP